MAEKIVSPGVFTKEIDQSFLPSAIAEVGAMIIGPTVKGPAGIPTKVESYADYVAQFGDTFESGSADGSDVKTYQYLTSHTAREYLKNNNTLTVVRILAGSYGGASATISSSIDPDVVGGGTKATGSLTLLGVGLSSGSLNSSCSFTPHGGDEVKFVFTGSGDGIKPADTSTLIYVDSGSSLAASAANLERAINISASFHNLPISASSDGATLGITSSKEGNLGVWSPTDDTDVDSPSPMFGGSQASKKYVKIVGTAGLAAVADSDVNPGSITSKSLGGGHDFNTETFRTPFKLHTLSDGKVMNSGIAGRLDAGDNSILLATGSKDNLRWEISAVNQKKGTFTLQLRRGDDIHKRKQLVETWSDLNLDPNSNNYIGKRIGDQYFTLAGTGGTGDVYLQPNGNYPVNSKYVRVEVLEPTIDYLDENGNVREPDYSASLPSFASGSNSGSFAGSFSGASDGTVQHPIGDYTYQFITDTNSQGLNPSNTGASNGYNEYVDALDLISNQDEYDFNLLMMPGIVGSLHSKLVDKAINVCETRGDCFVLSDLVAFNKTVSDATTQAKTYDSSYAAMYWPWVQMSDPVTGSPRFVPPSVALAGVYAFNDKVGYPWTAPAGLNRGTIPTAVQTEKVVTHDQRDDLYDLNVNPITSFPTDGVCVWGQKTLQKKASALDRVNVRRLLIRVKKFIASSARFLVFEQNTAATRRRFLNIANPFLEEVQSQSGVSAFRVVMDETNNTPDTIDRNILYGQIFIQPTRTAEFIVLDFTVQPTGATFPE